MTSVTICLPVMGLRRELEGDAAEFMATRTAQYGSAIEVPGTIQHDTTPRPATI